ncbi:MAG: rod shape-determining protein MreD [Rhodobacteraceae bacterium]|nr:rod shape-determining protein MreD [Paracoccaceae bacterium]
MADGRASWLWLMRGLYVLLGLIIIFFQLLPLETLPRRWAGPDLLIVMTFAWALRRPDYVPMYTVAPVMLLADLMFQRPPGLWAALVLIANEWLRARDRRQRETAFAVEWLTVALVLVGIVMLNRIILTLTVVPTSPLFLITMQTLFTIAVYPLVVLVSRLLFGVRRIAPGELDPGRWRP